MAKKVRILSQMAFSFDEPTPAATEVPAIEDKAASSEAIIPAVLPIMEEPPQALEAVSTPASETIGFRIKSIKTPAHIVLEPSIAIPSEPIAELITEIKSPELLEKETPTLVFKEDDTTTAIASSNITKATRVKTSVPKSSRGRKSLLSTEQSTATLQIPEDDILFQKQYYPIGEVATMFGVNTSLIRFWTNEFEMIKPRLNRKGDRLFRPVDIKNLLVIHELLRGRKLTIQGAKQFLKTEKKVSPLPSTQNDAINTLTQIRSFLMEMKTLLAAT